jgi:hypothetical protein
MTEPERSNRPEHSEDTQQIAKRPYVKPEFRHEAVFETMALSCGKIHSTQGACHQNHKNS